MPRTASRTAAVRDRLEGLYPGLIEWVALSQGGKITAVDPATMTLVTDFASHKADVANVIPPQQAGRIAQAAGIADRSGWCPVDPVSFGATLQPDIHVIGDAAIAGAMPKSAFAANAQAKVCAAAVVNLLAGKAPDDPRLINTCYSLVAPDYGISIAGVFHAVGGQLVDVAGAGGVSPLAAPRSFRQQEAQVRRAGSRRSRRKFSVSAAAIFAVVALDCPYCQAGERAGPYRVVDDAIPDSLTGRPGDALRGRAIVSSTASEGSVCCATAAPFPTWRCKGIWRPT